MPPTLVLPPRHTEDSSLLRDAALGAGWRVERLSSWRVPPGFAAEEPVVYGEPLFCAVAAEALGLALLEPPFDWLSRLPLPFVNRRVAFTDLAAARGLPGPAFFKPADDKCFLAGVYGSGAEVPAHESLPPGTPVVVSEPVRFLVEYRCFVCEGEVVAHSVYAREGALARGPDGSFDAPGPPGLHVDVTQPVHRAADAAARNERRLPATAEPRRHATRSSEAAEALSFCARLLRAASAITPPALVVDVGVIEGRGWSAVEANPCFGSGIYGADPGKVLQSVRRASVRAGALGPGDGRWVLARGG